MRMAAKWSLCAAGLVLCAGSASSMSGAALHPGGDEEKLLGKGDSSDVRFGNFPASNIEFLAQVPLSAFGLSAPSGNDCWGYTTPQGREIAIMGLETGTGFVDITNPASPVIIGAFSGPQSLWRDIKVIGTIAYVVTEGGSHIQKFDLANADSGVIGNLGFSSYTGSSASHNIVANPDSGFLYRVGGANDLGLRAYGVGVNGAPGTPTNPSQQTIQSNLYVHDAQVVTFTSGPFAGREIAYLCSGFGNGGSDTRLRIYDVTNKASIVELSSVAYPGRAYCHQGWLSEDRKYFYINDELDVPNSTMRIINVENINAPFHVKNWNNGNPARHHNLYVRGDFIYAANYRSGLRIHDISDPENPIEVAWLDTFPGDDGTGFDGAWSNYPYFPSGNVIISDIQQGLVVVRPNLESLTFTLANTLGATIDPAGGNVVIATIAERGISLDGASPRLNVRDEAGVVTSIAGTSTGVPNQFRFETPVLDCLEQIDWWVSAESTDGQAFTLPSIAPTNSFSTIVATSTTAVFSDNAETDPGYTVTGTASDGQWARAIPVNAGRGDPATDADGSGRAWVTDNEAGNSDVDNGSTVLTSPVIDASAGGSLSYSYWYNDIPTGPAGAEDFLRVEYATNAAGTNWAVLRTYSQVFNEWRQETVLVGASGEIPASATLRLRFTAADNSPGSVVEAGVDAISLTSFACVQPPKDCPADTNGDGILSPADFSAWIAAFNAGAPECDQNGDNACTPADFSAWIANFNAGAEAVQTHFVWGFGGSGSREEIVRPCHSAAPASGSLLGPHTGGFAMHQVLPASRSVRFLITILCASAAAPASAQVLMLQPASASTNMGNFGTYEPFRAIDQSGLSATYTSGVTELAPFAAATHTVNGGSSFTTWFSQISTTGNYDMNLGGSFLISAIVIWADPQHIGQTVNQFTLLADDNAAFSSPVNLGTFSCADGNPNASNFGQVFTFAPTTASHVRMVIASNHGSTLTTGFVEVALGVGEDSPPCPADTNGDGTLSPADFSAWIAAFNAGAPECDQNGDNACTPADFSAWIANFNAGC